MTAVGSSRFNSETITLKETLDLTTAKNFATLIKTDIASVVTSLTVGSKEITQVLKEDSLGPKSFSPNVFKRRMFGMPNL